MDNQDQRKTHNQGHETHGGVLHVCHKCGWPFPNPHPSSKHRRAHKKICGNIEGYNKLLISVSESQTHSNASDDEHEPFSDDDRNNTQGANALDSSKNEKASDGIGGRLIRSGDEVFLDAIANFSDGAPSPGTKEPLDSTAKYPEFSGSSEDNACNSEAGSSGFLGNKICAGENVRNCSLTSAASDEIEIDSDGDMVEIMVSSDNTSVETCKGVPETAVSDVVNLKEKNCAEFNSVIPQDELALEVNSTVNSNTSTNGIQVDSTHMIQLATSSDDQMLEEREEGNMNMFTHSSCDDGPEMSHLQNEHEDVKDHDGELFQNSLSLHSSEALKQKLVDLKDSVSEESQSSEKGEIFPSDVHVLDGSMKEQYICKLWDVEMCAEKSIEVSSVKFMVEEQESDAAPSNLEQINLPSATFMAVSEEKNPSGASFVGSTNETTTQIGTDNVYHHEKNIKNMNEVAVDGKYRGAYFEIDKGIISIKTLQPSKLHLEAKSSSGGVYWNDGPFEMGEIEKCDIIDGQCMERPLVKDIKYDEINSGGGRVTEECDTHVGSSTDSCQAQGEELLLKATEHREGLPSTEVGISNSKDQKAASERHQCEKPELFEPPSFMTLVEPGHGFGPEASASEVQKLPSSNSLRAGWFPTITPVTNESQGRKKNEETIAKITNGSTNKLHKPPKSLLGEGSHDKKPKSPKLEENPVNQKNSEVREDNNGSGPKSPATQAVEGEGGTVKRQNKKVKSRPYWLQFVCCSSVDSQQRR